MAANINQGTVRAPKKYELTITADSITSTEHPGIKEEELWEKVLSHGKKYKTPSGEECIYYITEGANPVYRNTVFDESTSSSKTLPRLACQVFETQLSELDDEEREYLPVNQQPGSEPNRGLYTSVAEYKAKTGLSTPPMTYDFAVGERQFAMRYSSDIFFYIAFAKECLKRWDKRGKFVLTYLKKDKSDETDAKEQEEFDQQIKQTKSEYAKCLLESKNLILRGAPGTGKTYLARDIAAQIVSKGNCSHFKGLDETDPSLKEQIEFVQFHPNYDYSDFVEGLRPKLDDDGTMHFCLQDGVFKQFVARARKNYEDSLKDIKEIEKEESVREALDELIEKFRAGDDKVHKTKNNTEFIVENVDDKYIHISIPKNSKANAVNLRIDDLGRMVEDEKTQWKMSDIKEFFDRTYNTQADSYALALWEEVQAESKKIKKEKKDIATKKRKNYVFIIDEINRGEISKIFGELFFSIDPGYRGKAGEISTQYANMHKSPNEKFYIPNNVYIIGTMNDIDRSVESFDFAMRRRFRFIEVKVNDFISMLDEFEDAGMKEKAKRKMNALNEEIKNTPELNENYQIGPAYFLKLKTLSLNGENQDGGFKILWTDYLQPLLQEYIHGMHDEEGIMKRFEDAYKTGKPSKER